MADKVIIGKVAVKVHPDSTEFPREARRQLEAIEKRLKIKVPLELDERGLGRTIKSAIDRLNSPAEQARRAVKIGAELNTENLASDAKRAAKTAEQALRDIERRFSIGVDVDERTLRDAKKHFDDLVQEYDGTDVGFEALAHTAIARAELARASRDRIVNLVVNVSKNSLAKAEATLASLAGLRMLRSTLTNVWDLFKNLDKSIPIVGSIAEAVLGLSAGLLASASNAFALARALAQIGPIALLLPGIMGGLALGIGASVAVLRDFNKELPHVKQAFKDIQDQMSATFWKQASKPIQDMIDHLLPQFGAGLQATSLLLGDWFGGLARNLEGSFDGALGQMFADLAASIQIATGANGALANSITILGRYGARYLPRLAGWYADVVTSFSEWLTRNDESGKLYEWIEVAVANLKDLGSVLRESGRILAGIARAANEAGGSGLDSLADTLKRVADTVNGEPFKSNLVTVLRAAHDAMGLISDRSGPAFNAFFDDFSSTLAQGLTLAGDAIGMLLKGVFEALDTRGFAEGFIAFLDGVRDGIQSLSGVWTPLGNALGGVGQIAGEMARTFGPLLADLLRSLSSILVDNLPAIQQTIRSLTDAVSSVLPVVLPVIEGIAKGVATLGSSSLSSVTGIVAVASALVALRLALSGQAIATGLAGILSFVGQAGKIDKATSALRRFTIAAAGISIAIAGFAALGEWITSAGTQAPEIDRLATSLERLGNSSTVENLEAVNKAMQGDSSKPWILEPAFDVDYQGLSDGIGSVADAMQLVTERADSSGWAKFIGEGDANNYLGLGSTGFQQATQSIESLDSAMAQVVASGNADAIAASERMLRDAAAETGIAYDAFVKEHLPNYLAAQDAAAVAQQTTARIQSEALLAQRTAMAQYEGAVARVQGLSPALMTSINDTSKTFIDLAAALKGEALPSVDAWIAKLEEQVTAQAAWADNMVALAKRGVSEGVLTELAKLGPEGAPMVAQLVDASESELTRLEGVMKAKTGGAAADAKSNFAKMNTDVQAELAKLSPATQKVLADMGVQMGQGGSRAGDALANALSRKKLKAQEAALSMANGAVQGAGSKTGEMQKKGAEAGDAMARGVSSKTGAAKGSGSAIAKAVDVGAVVDLFSNGVNAAAGFIEGILSRVGDVAAAAGRLAGAAMSAAKKKLDEHSPSKEMFKIGDFAVQGLENALLDGKRPIEKAAETLAETIMGVDFRSPFADMEVSAKTGRASVRTSLIGEGDETPKRSLEVNFNAPVGGDPYEIARSIEQRQNDAMALEGLDL